MKLHASGEDYLEAILVLHKKMGMVRSVDVARHMEVTKPSVCHAVNTLKDGGFLTMDELSSVVIVQRDKGSGLNISTTNINYCTVGMYKNALTTAGVTDADIIVAGPTPISGTAALVGVLKAYQEMTGKEISDSVVDTALNELVLTGQLEDSLKGVSDAEVEEFIAYIKALIAKDDLTDDAGINGAIDEACEKYGVTLSDDERQQIIDLIKKIICPPDN